jgi:very-short-patch-repair endonuclease
VNGVNRAKRHALLSIARDQRGLVRHVDVRLIDSGQYALRNLLRDGGWQPILPGVLAAATAVISPGLIADAAMLWDPNCLLCGSSAAQREGIWVPEVSAVRVTVPFASSRRSLPGLDVVRTRHFPVRHHTNGFHRWTEACRSLVDLSLELTPRQLEASLLSAIRLKKTTAADVDAAAEGMRNRKGMAGLYRVTGLWSPERESLLEDVLRRDVTSVVPTGVTRQLIVPRAGGSPLARLDVAVEELRLGFEADGLFFHSTDEQIASDQQRDRALMGHGWQVVRFREGVLDHRSPVQADISAIVAERRRQLRGA